MCFVFLFEPDGKGEAIYLLINA